MDSDEYFDNCFSKEKLWSKLLVVIFKLLPHILQVVGTCAILANGILLFIAILGLWRHRIPKKRLLFVINRSFVDFLTAIISMVYLNTVQTKCDMIDCVNEPLIPNIFMQSLLTIDYWILAGSYFGISILTCYAVRTPLKYKLTLTIPRIIQFLVLGWIIIIGSLVGISLTTEQQTMFDSNGMMYMMRNQYHEHGTTLGHWMVGFCEIIMGKSVAEMGVISLVLPFLSYLTTLLSYAFVAFLLFRRRNDQRVANRHQACVWRLGMHLGVFTLSFILMALAYFTTFPMVDSCNNWSEHLQQRFRGAETKTCDISHLEAFMRYAILTSLSSIGWFLRMSLDPAIDLITDTNLRRIIVRSQIQERTSTFTLLEKKPSGELTARSSC